MRIDMFLKSVLGLLLVALTVTLTLWFTSEQTEAWAQGGGGSSSGNWILVASTLREGEGLLYVFNTEKEVLLVYSYNRGRKTASGASGRNLFDGDFEFLAGRHCKWDVLYSQLRPYPTETPKSDRHTPAQMKALFESVSRE